MTGLPGLGGAPWRARPNVGARICVNLSGDGALTDEQIDRALERMSEALPDLTRVLGISEALPDLTVAPVQTGLAGDVLVMPPGFVRYYRAMVMTRPQPVFCIGAFT